MSNHVFWNAKTKVIIDIFWTQSFCFLSFQNSRQMCSAGQGGGRQGGGGQGGGGVSHIGAGIILSASCLLALFCFMFEV